MNLLPQFFYGMVVLSSLSMVGDRGGFGGVGMGLGALGGHWRGHWDVALVVGGGHWKGLGRHWRVVRVEAGSLIYRQIKSHCSEYVYLLVSI